MPKQAPWSTPAVAHQTDIPARSLSCHSCKTRRDVHSLAPCNGVLSFNHEPQYCIKLFCKLCLNKYYNEDLPDPLLESEYLCPFCRGRCVCSACRKFGQQAIWSGRKAQFIQQLTQQFKAKCVETASFDDTSSSSEQIQQLKSTPQITPRQHDNSTRTQPLTNSPPSPQELSPLVSSSIHIDNAAASARLTPHCSPPSGTLNNVNIDGHTDTPQTATSQSPSLSPLPSLALGVSSDQHKPPTSQPQLDENSNTAYKLSNCCPVPLEDSEPSPFQIKFSPSSPHLTLQQTIEEFELSYPQPQFDPKYTPTSYELYTFIAPYISDHELIQRCTLTSTAQQKGRYCDEQDLSHLRSLSKSLFGARFTSHGASNYEKTQRLHRTNPNMRLILASASAEEPAPLTRSNFNPDLYDTYTSHAGKESNATSTHSIHKPSAQKMSVKKRQPQAVKLPKQTAVKAKRPAESACPTAPIATELRQSPRRQSLEPSELNATSHYPTPSAQHLQQNQASAPAGTKLLRGAAARSVAAKMSREYGIPGHQMMLSPTSLLYGPNGPVIPQPQVPVQPHMQTQMQVQHTLQQPPPLQPGDNYNYNYGMTTQFGVFGQRENMMMPQKQFATQDTQTVRSLHSGQYIPQFIPQVNPYTFAPLLNGEFHQGQQIIGQNGQALLYFPPGQQYNPQMGYVVQQAQAQPLQITNVVQPTQIDNIHIINDINQYHIQPLQQQQQHSNEAGSSFTSQLPTHNFPQQQFQPTSDLPNLPQPTFLPPHPSQQSFLSPPLQNQLHTNSFHLLFNTSNHNNNNNSHLLSNTLAKSHGHSSPHPTGVPPLASSTPPSFKFASNPLTPLSSIVIDPSHQTQPSNGNHHISPNRQGPISTSNGPVGSATPAHRAMPTAHPALFPQPQLPLPGLLSGLHFITTAPMLIEPPNLSVPHNPPIALFTTPRTFPPIPQSPHHLISSPPKDGSESAKSKTFHGTNISILVEHGENNIPGAFCSRPRTANDPSDNLLVQLGVGK